ncbi:MAG: hypothetical protein CMJ90_12365 [Planctomycetes bacterium]|nr:hypothetical protein [Planctomycetota bacterium]
MPHRKDVLLLLAASVGLAWALFLPAMDAPMVRDDLVWFPLVYPDGTFSGEAAGKLLWPDDPAYSYNNHFRPIGWLSILADDRALGHEVQDFRTAAITLHGIIGFIVGLLAIKLGASRIGGLIAAGLFVTYGGAHEAVVLPAHRFTLLSTLFFGLSALAAHRHGRSGGVGLVGVFALLAVLSKDSMLSMLFALVPFTFVVAPAGKRLRAAATVGVTVAAVAVADVMLRKAATGAWLPALSDQSDNVVSGLDAGDILGGLPSFISTFAAPVALKTGDDVIWSVIRFACMGAMAAATIWALTRTARSRVEHAPGLVLILSLATLSFPVLYVSEHLDNARNLYPIAMVFFPWLVATTGRKAPWLLLILVLNAPMLLKNQRTYTDLTPVFTSAVEQTEAVARSGLPVTVMGLPPSVNDTPAFGHALVHFPMRFHPPLHPHHRTVLALTSDEAPRPPVNGTPWGLLSLDAADDGVLTTAWARRVPSDAESAAASGFELRRPARDASWPSDGAATVAFAPGPGIDLSRDAILRVRVRFGDQEIAWYLRADGPGIRRTGDTVDIDLLATPSLAPISGLAALQSAAARKIPATIEVDLLPAPGSACGPGTGRSPFVLARR